MKEEICKQIGGNHYQSDYQPLNLILKYNLNFIQGSIIKYVTRHRRKNKEEDLLKAFDFYNGRERRFGMTSAQIQEKTTK